MAMIVSADDLKTTHCQTYEEDNYLTTKNPFIHFLYQINEKSTSLPLNKVENQRHTQK